jgi:PAS domain S-box-containing protein
MTTPAADDAHLKNALFEATLAASPVVVFSQDLELRYTWIHNPAQGYTPEQVIGRRDVDLFQHAGDAAELESIKREVIATGRTQRREVRLQHAGIARSYDLVVQPHRDGSGAVVGVVCAAVDVTERTNAQARLREREEQLALFIRHTPAAIAMFDREMRYLAVSRRFAEDYRLQEADLVGRTHYEVFPELPAKWRAIHERCLEGAAERSDGEAFERPDGTVDWVRWEIRPWRAANGAIGGLLLFSEVITERRRAEVALRDSEERRSLAMRAGRMGAWEYDVATGRNFWEGRLAELLGLPRERAGTAAEHWLDLIHPDDRARVEADFRAAVAGRGPYATEFRVVGGDGSVRRFASVAHTVRDESGRVARLVGIVQDVTTDRRLTEQLQQADRRKDVFLATLSHELRSPLAPIRTAAALLANPGLDGTQLAWTQAVIRRQVEHMARLLDDLLDVSRITQGKLTLKRERVSLAATVDAAMETARPLMDRKQHRVEIRLPRDDVQLDADPVRVAQILSNLLTNAAKYTDPGGHVDVSARLDGAHVELAVRDDGIGIAAEELPHLFEMFTQAGASRGRAEGGLGIGLALVKGLAELHGGAIHASSDGPGRGSTFVVRLPAVASRSGAKPAVASFGAPGRRTRRLLVADDNRDGADALAMSLRLAGHEVRIAYDGAAALTVAEAFRPEVAILDIGMPELDGYEVARALRRAPWASGLTLYALTGWGQDEDCRRAIDAGFDHHLTKPVDPAELERRIAALTPPGPRRS